MSESPIQLRGKSGGVVFEGTQSPGGGSQPVSCVLAVDAVTIDVTAANPAFIVYDTIYDNPVDMNALEGLPDGIGLTGVGTDTLITTEAGIWAFSLGDLAPPPDATWSGDVNFGNLGSGGPSFWGLPVNPAGIREVSLCQVLPLPAGAGFSVGINTVDPATADPYLVPTGTLTIVRLT